MSAHVDDVGCPCCVGRRRFLALGAGAIVAATALPTGASAASDSSLLKTLGGDPRSLAFKNLHTGERLNVTYWKGGSYLRDSLHRINVLLRDRRTGDMHEIDPKLMDLLHLVRMRIGTAAPFEVISGYRSPQTNAMLRQASTGVAVRSMHMEGKAIDVRLEGHSVKALSALGRELAVGGVGTYRDFVHLDVGRPRVW